jgi:hypothetical protein
VVFKPDAELRGIGAQMIDAETAAFISVSRVTMSLAANAVPACPAMDFAAPAGPAGRSGRQSFAAGDVPSVRVVAPTKFADGSRF